MGLRKIVFGVVLITIILSLAWWFLAGVQDVSLESFALTGIQDVDTQGFTFSGDLGVKNPSNAPVPIQSVTYTAVLESTEQTISSGRLDGFTLAPDQVTSTDLTSRVDWIPTAQTAVSLLTDEQVWMRVEGEIVIAEFTIPFSDRIDIAEYVEQFVPTNADSMVRDSTTQASDSLLNDDLPLS